MIRTLVASLVLVTPCLVGCGGVADKPELVAVQGTVMLNGSPVDGATVTFSTEKSSRPATGETDASGKFKLTTYDTYDGAVPGEHTVTISKVEASGEGSMQPGASAEQMQEKMKQQMEKMKNPTKEAPKSQLPGKYADAKTSGEKRTVVKGDVNDFKFELTE